MAREDADYLARVRQLPCCAPVISGKPCHGPIEAHHAGLGSGVAQKAHDHTAIPLCMQHHRDWHAAAGPFRSFQKGARRDWAREQISKHQRMLGVAQME